MERLKAISYAYGDESSLDEFDMSDDEGNHEIAHDPNSDESCIASRCNETHSIQEISFGEGLETEHGAAQGETERKLRAAASPNKSA